MQPMYTEEQIEKDDLTVVMEQRLDEWTVKATRVKMTPALCLVPKCGFDFLKKNKMPAWDELAADEKLVVRKRMAEHAQKHAAELAVVMPARDVPTSWPPRPTGNIPKRVVVE